MSADRIEEPVKKQLNEAMEHDRFDFLTRLARDKKQFYPYRVQATIAAGRIFETKRWYRQLFALVSDEAYPEEGRTEVGMRFLAAVSSRDSEWLERFMASKDTPKLVRDYAGSVLVKHHGGRKDELKKLASRPDAPLETRINAAEAGGFAYRTVAFKLAQGLQSGQRYLRKQLFR